MNCKRSRRVGLVLIGSLSLAACEQAPTQRDVYASREDCAVDWGEPGKNCEPVKDHRTGAWRYYGPHYNYGSRPATMNHGASRAIASHVSRGGFGSTAAAHGAGS